MSRTRGRMVVRPHGSGRVVKVHGYGDRVKNGLWTEVGVAHVRPEQSRIDGQGHVEAAVVVEGEYGYALVLGTAGAAAAAVLRGGRVGGAAGRRRARGLYPLGRESLLYAVLEFVISGVGWTWRLRRGEARVRVAAVVAVVAHETRRRYAQVRPLDHRLVVRLRLLLLLDVVQVAVAAVVVVVQVVSVRTAGGQRAAVRVRELVHAVGRAVVHGWKVVVREAQSVACNAEMRSC